MPFLFGRLSAPNRPRPHGLPSRWSVGGALGVLAVVLAWPVRPLAAQPVAPPSRLQPPTEAAYPGSRRPGEIDRPRELVSDIVGWVALGRVAWSSGYDQVAGSPDVWPRTVEGYGRRVVTRSAQLVSIELSRHAMAAALGRDPAYVKCACEGRWARLGHATLGVLTDFDARGQRRVAWPRFTGAAVGAVVLGQLQPGQGKAGTVAWRAVTTVGGGWFGNVAKEFDLWPGGASTGAKRP